MPSYCHPWSSGVTSYLSKFTLGLSPLSPGFASGYLATPHVSAAHAYVSGAVPTPRGRVALEASWDDASCTATVAVDAPPNLGGAVGLPRRYASRRRQQRRQQPPAAATATGAPASLGGRHDGLQLRNLTVDGKSVPLDAAVPPAKLPEGASAEWHAWRHRHHAHTPWLTGRKHVVRATYAPCAAAATTTTSTIVESGTADGGEGGDGRDAADDDAAAAQPLTPLFPPPTYPVAKGAIDTTTRGAWVGRYGAAGYVLFAFANGTDIVHIPSAAPPSKPLPAVSARGGGGGSVGSGLLRNITFFHPPQRRFSGCLPGNATALERPPGSEPDKGRGSSAAATKLCARALGVATLGGDGSQGVVVDIRFDAGAEASTGAPATVPATTAAIVAPRKHRVAVYMVGATASQAIRIMDLDTLNVVSPTPYLTAEQLATGAYFVLETDRSLRLRLMSTHNDNTISAVFVDPA